MANTSGSRNNVVNPNNAFLGLRAGFEMVRSKGSHRIYIKGNKRVVIPFHTGRALHPKIVKQVLKSI